MSSFFINRPVFACVISILIVLAGLLALKALPVEQYPNITPPLIMVQATYTGADADTVAQTLAAPIEQQVNGVEDMIYMYSQNASSGTMALNVYFKIGADADMAQVNVQNRVNLALPLLPEEVQRTGVSITKQTPNILLIIAVQSPQGRYDDIYLSNYSNINIQNELARLNGVSQVNIIGARQYSMRLWLKPDRLTELKLSATDVVDAVRQQNAQFAIGQIGGAPTIKPVQMTIPATAKGRLAEPEEFEDIIIRATDDGSFVQLKDVGRAELGAQNYDVIGELDGKTTTLIAIYQQYGANALAVADEVKATMEKLSKNFPADITYSIPYDTTEFVEASIKEVVITIFEATVLVILCVLLFLQNGRATVVPVLALLVSIIGTFAGMYVLGFSINTLTLFGIVLAVGTVVDDAIVVIENVEHNMRTLKSTAKEAAIKAMSEVTAPVIAIVFVLCAVFIPVAFLGGIAGQLYKQFAITISVSVIISGIVALTLSPAIAALFLKIQTNPNRFSVWFNRNFDRITNAVVGGSRWMINHRAIALGLFAVLLSCLAFLFHIVPTSFVPNEDQGYIMIMAQLPDASSLDRTKEVANQINKIALENPAVKNVVSLTGFSLLEGLNRTQVASIFVILKDWSLRKSKDMHADAVLKELWKNLSHIQEAQIIPFNPPAIQGLGTVGGFEFWIENRGDSSIEELYEIVNEFIAAANKRPEIAGLTSNLEIDDMQLYVDLDRYKSMALGVKISDVFQTLQILLGSLYINNFNKWGQVYQVVAQAEPAYRSSIHDIGEVYVKSDTQQMIPLKSLLDVKFKKGPTIISRFNGFYAARLNGSSAPGYSSGQSMKAMEEVAKEILPQDMSYSWGGQAFQEQTTGGTSSNMLVGGIIVVFLILAALYERWSLPLAIVLSAPFGILGAIFSIWLRGLPNDVYFQIGMVALIALAAKNAILIVEFAIIKRQEGATVIEAAIEATRLRFRAIVMTSLTFIFGVFPLVVSTGAGAASRHSLGTGVLGGMIFATFFAVLFVPLFFFMIEGYANPKHGDTEKK